MPSPINRDTLFRNEILAATLNDQPVRRAHFMNRLVPAAIATICVSVTIAWWTLLAWGATELIGG
jgi:hypothetical protein